MSEDWVCERHYQTTVEGQSVSFVVRWAKPAPDSRGGWNCAYVIEWPHRPHVHRWAMGVDSTQALHLALQIVGVELYVAEPAVFWWEPDDVLGLPLMPASADLETARTKGHP